MEEYDEGMSLSELFRILLRRIHWIIWIFVGICLIASIYVLQKPVSYEASARVQVSSLRSLENPDSNQAPTTDLSVELAYLLNRQTLVAALETLDLSAYEDPNLPERYDSEKDLQRLAEQVETSQLKGTNIVEITFGDTDARFAEDFMHALVSTFEQELLGSVRVVKLKEQVTLQTELSDAQLHYTETYDQLDAFRLEHNLSQMHASKALWNLSVPFLQTKIESLESQESATTPETASQSLSRLDGLAPAFEQYKTAFQNVVYLEMQGLLTGTTNTEKADASQSIVETAAQEQLKRASASFDQSWSALSDPQGNIEGISSTSAKRHLETGILEALRMRYIDNLDQLAKLETQEGIFLTDRARYQSQITAITRDLENLNLHMANLTEALRTLTPIVVDEGSSGSTSPMLIMAVAVLLGLALGVLAALLIDMITPTIDHPDILVRTLGNEVRQMGSVPLWKKSVDPKTPNLVTKGTDHAAIVETYNLVGGTLLFSGDTQDHRCFGITSAGLSEGTTFTVANLGLSLAKSGKNVLLVDASGSQDSLSACFAQNPKNKGLADVVCKEFNWKQATRQPDMELPNLHLMPFGDGSVHRSTVVHHQHFKRSIEEIREHYDVVLIDTPSFATPSDLLAVAQATEGVVLNIRAGIASRSNVKNLVEILQVTNVPLLGVLMNASYPTVFGLHKAYRHQAQHIVKKAEYKRTLRLTAIHAKSKRAIAAEHIA